MKSLHDCRLYTFIDTAYVGGRDLEQLATQLCKGGSDLIQFRAKNWTVGQVENAVRQIMPILRNAGVGLVINDHPQIAANVGADVCHLGQEDFFEAGHQSTLELKGDASFMVGLSTHAPDQAIRAVQAGADYIAIGPVFATPTKPTARAVTLDYVRWAASNIKTTWFAIGGIHLGNLDQVLEAGAQRVCVVSAILNAPDVTEACRRFKERLIT